MVYTTTKLAWQKMLSLLKTDIIVQEMLQLDFPTQFTAILLPVLILRGMIFQQIMR